MSVECVEYSEKMDKKGGERDFYFDRVLPKRVILSEGTRPAKVEMFNVKESLPF